MIEQPLQEITPRSSKRKYRSIRKHNRTIQKFFNAGLSQALQEMITDHIFSDKFDYKATTTGNAGQVNQILDCQTLNQSIHVLQTQWQAIYMENAINKIYTTKRKIHTDKPHSHQRYMPQLYVCVCVCEQARSLRVQRGPSNEPTEHGRSLEFQYMYKASILKHQFWHIQTEPELVYNMWDMVLT